MASSSIDQKFLGRLAKAVENDNSLLSQMLLKILGLSLALGPQLVTARKQKQPDPNRPTEYLDLAYHILWLSREGLTMLEQYVLPWANNNAELVVLAYKLRASFLHIYALFHNTPAVSSMNVSHIDISRLAAPIPDKGKGKATDDDLRSSMGSIQPTHELEGGPVGPPPGIGFGWRAPRNPDAPFVKAKIIPEANYLESAHECFKVASKYADELLWNSHSLRLSVKVEYVAFLYDCLHDVDLSREGGQRYHCRGV